MARRIRAYPRLLELAREQGQDVPAMSEGDFRAWVINLAQSHGWKVAAIRTVRVQRKNGQVYYETPMEADGCGWPDLFLVKPASGRRAIAVELKADKGTFGPGQREWLLWLGGAGIDVYCWRPKDHERIEAILK